MCIVYCGAVVFFSAVQVTMSIGLTGIGGQLNVFTSWLASSVLS